MSSDIEMIDVPLRPKEDELAVLPPPFGFAPTRLNPMLRAGYRWKVE